MRLTRSLLALAAGACPLLAPASASAYELAGRPWPGRTITVHVRAQAYAPAVRRAVRAWNDADVGVRLRRVSAAEGADVVVRYGGRRCEGEALVGYARIRSTVYLGRGCDLGLVRLTAVHELGHVIGLGHERDRCARMNAAFDDQGTPSLCPARPLEAWLEAPLRPDDVRGARALYRRR